jgi:chromosome partitioning protein
MARVISLIARKGGVGKTTIAANLAGELGQSGAKIRAIDADPQGSLSMWASMGNGFLRTSVTAVSGGAEAELKEAVRRLEEEADLLVIDTPPGFGDAALLAMAVSDLVLLPCGASPLDLAAGRDALALCREVQRQRAGRRMAIGLVPSRYSPNTGLGRDLPDSLKELGERTTPGIAHRVALAEAAIAGLTIGEYAPKSAAHREFQELAKTVWRWLDEKCQTA